jgi:hypothetical protein
MARIYYSAACGGFFHEALHTALPEDAVRIAALRHAELMTAQSEGRQIIADARGRPVLAPVRVPGLEELRAQATARWMPRPNAASLAWPASPASPTTTP